MTKRRWRRIPALLAAALAVWTAGLGEQAIPEIPEARKRYQLEIRIQGPAEAAVSHSGRGTNASPVTDEPAAGTDILYVLPEGPAYQAEISGTGEGTLTLTVTRKDPEGKEADEALHRFENIPVTAETKMTAGITGGQCTLLTDAKGDGRIDTARGSGKNSPDFTVTRLDMTLAGILVLVIAALLVFRRKSRVTVFQKPVLQRRA